MRNNNLKTEADGRGKVVEIGDKRSCKQSKNDKFHFLFCRQTQTHFKKSNWKWKKKTYVCDREMFRKIYLNLISYSNHSLSGKHCELLMRVWMHYHIIHKHIHILNLILTCILRAITFNQDTTALLSLFSPRLVSISTLQHAHQTHKNWTWSEIIADIAIFVAIIVDHTWRAHDLIKLEWIDRSYYYNRDFDFDCFFFSKLTSPEFSYLAELIMRLEPL